MVPPPELPDPSEPWDVFVVPPADEPGVSVSAVSFPDTPPDSFPLPLFESLSGFSEESFPEEPLSVEPVSVEPSPAEVLL